MKRLLCLGLSLLTLSLGSCGYHAGGLVNKKLEGVKTFYVTMFDNLTTYPNAGMLATSAIGNSLQTDGTFRMAAPGSADVEISGTVTTITIEQSLVDWQDTHLSLEFRITMQVDYKVKRVSDGKVIKEGSASGDGSYYNTGGNVQSGRDAALSYAARNVAEEIVASFTTL